MKIGQILSSINLRKKSVILLFAILVASFYLIFYGLGTRYLWQDEAQTPLIAKTILQTGFPYGTDGVNYFSQEGGIEYGPNYLWKFHPWLPFYISAISIKLFGTSNFALRFPFALFGFASLLLVSLFVWRMTSSLNKVIFATAAAGFSLSFLLLVRQCRYYSVEMFFVLLATFLYLSFLRYKKNFYLILLFISLSALFNTIYLYFFIVIFTIFIHLFVIKSSDKKRILAVVIAAILFNVPLLFTLYNANFTTFNGNMFNLNKIFNTLRVFGEYIIKYTFPYFMVVAALFILFFKRKDNKEEESPDVSPLIFLVILSVMTPFVLAILTPTPFFRNMAGITIPLALLAAYICHETFVLNKAAGLILFLFFIFSSPFLKFVHEINSDWFEAGESIVKFINSKALPGQTVLITYPDLPVKLYTKLKVYGGLTGEDISNVTKPDYVIIRRARGSDYEAKTSEHILNSIDKKSYFVYELPCADVLWENREDIVFHDYEVNTEVSRLMIFEHIPTKGKLNESH